MKEVGRAVVTGASGFIGAALLDFLIKKGIQTVAVDRNPIERGDCQSILVDLKEKGSLDDILSPDIVVFHLAARASVPQSVEHPVSDFGDTLQSLLSVLESCRQAGSSLVYPSTASVFDFTNIQPVDERAYKKPSSPYGAAKIAGEAYCSAYFRCFDLDVRIARLFSVYGTGMRRFAIHDIVRKIQRNPEKISLLGDGEQIRDYLFIDDVIAGLWHIATEGEAGEDYNLASGKQTRLLDLTRKIARLMGVPNIEIELSGQSFAGDIDKWYGDVTKLSSTGFAPEVSFDSGLEQTVLWLQRNPT